MKRHLCITVLFALALIPDWASACWPRWGSPADDRAYYVPIYHGPVYYAPQPVYVQPIYVQPCVPMLPPVLQPPRIEQPKAQIGGSTGPARAAAQPTPPAPAKLPVVEQVRPAAGLEAPTTKPETAPPAEKPRRGGLFEISNDPPPEHKAPTAERPKNAEVIPPTPVPTGASADPKLSPSELPKLTDPKLSSPELPKLTDPKLPSLDLPRLADPKLPSLDMPMGTGTDLKLTDPKLPSLDTSGSTAVPVPAPPPDSLPPLTVPPDAPVAPLPPVKPMESKSRSSPLSGAARELRVSVFPASGAVTANGSRKVGFYNHTGRDLALTLEGRTVTLPAMTYLHAQLPATFTWKCGDRPAAQATVPADATGLDVLIRE